MAREYSNSQWLRSHFPNPRTSPPTLDSFLLHASTSIPIDNRQTRYFGGAEVRNASHISEAGLTAAMCALSRFDLVLRLEDNFVPLLQQALGWNLTIRAGTRNNAERYLATNVTNSTSELAVSMNRLDERLYEFAGHLSHHGSIGTACAGKSQGHPLHSSGPATMGTPRQ